jgi:hypothetical protein
MTKGDCFPGLEQPERELTHLSIVSMLRMGGSLYPLLHRFSGRAALLFKQRGTEKVPNTFI